MLNDATTYAVGIIIRGNLGYKEYETMKARFELRAQLAIAEAESLAGSPRISHADLMEQIREKIRGKQLRLSMIMNSKQKAIVSL